MANVLQAFNDSQLGVVLGTVLHTLGAIAFLGGLVGYLAWHRQLKAGHHHGNVLATSAFLAYIAIVVNLVGGFMRTYETGHPHVWEFAESAWVRAIVIKHVFLFAAYGAAIVLFEVVAPRQLRALRAGQLAQASQTGHRLGVLVVALGIFLASVLGGVAQVLLTTPAAEAGPDMTGFATATTYSNATGSLTSNALAPSVASSTFDVAIGTTALDATLAWSPDQFVLNLQLVAPSGAAKLAAPSGAGRVTSSTPFPEPGTWEYRITSDLAVNAQWSLSVVKAVDQQAGEFLADSTLVAPGNGYEINLNMTAGGVLYWDWSAGAPLHFNVHSHFNDTVQNYVDEDAATGRASFTAGPAGIYSLYWTATGAVPVSLTYRVWGDVELHSIT